jgi:CelD/BcsL family acetyltransferase involved in cellulose biosynthesis
MLDLHVLRVGASAAAYELAFDIGERTFAYNASFREELASHSPGNLMTLEVIRSACERGRREYDMLRGDEPYKLRWSASARSEVQLLLAAPGLRAALGVLLGPAL